MDSKLNDKKEPEDKQKIEESQTEFMPRSSISGSFFSPLGKLGKYLSKFFATDSQPYLNTQSRQEPTELHPLAGDTVSNFNVIKPSSSPAWGRNIHDTPILPQLESARKRRYKELESMDEYPEISSAWDIYADDCTQKDISGDRWIIKSESKFVVEEVKAFFKKIKLDRMYWDIIRNTCKFGDAFIETVVDTNRPKLGIQRIKTLNPFFIYRNENEYGYLENFFQEIPASDDGYNTFGANAADMNKVTFLPLDMNQIVHFRISNSDANYYPYGKSVAAPAVKIYRSLKLMEDAMLIYRLARAPERRVFYIDVTGMPTAKASMYIEKLKEKFKKEKFYDGNTGKIGARYNPLSADEDFFVPIKGNQKAKIETLPGADNLGDIDDVKYFRDKLLSAMKIPKDYISEKDKSPERKANLAQLDVKFARTITRLQSDIEVSLEVLAKRHLLLKGFSSFLVEGLSINLPEPSDMFTKRKIEVDEAKARVVQAVLGTEMFPKRQIYKEYYDLTDSEIESVMDQLNKEAEEEALKEQERQAQLMANMPGTEGAEAPGAPMADDRNSSSLEPQENETPEEAGLEESVSSLYELKTHNKDLSYTDRKILQRALNRINQ